MGNNPAVQQGGEQREMGSRPLKRPTGRSLVHAEDLNSSIERLLSAAEGIAQQFSTAVVPSRPEPPDFSAYVHAGLRQALEDELVPVVETVEGEIEPGELKREIIKKALIGLKLPVLRDVARSRGLSGSGASEDLAARVAATYSWNEEEIAQLVLDNEEEPASTERGFESRVFALREEMALSHVKRRLEYVAGRYIRTGVARWFVFDDPTQDGDRIELPGSYRAYRAGVEANLGGEAELTSIPSKSTSRLELGARRTFVVHDGGATAARSSASALGLASGVEVLPYLPFGDVRAKGERGSFHVASQFMLDLLYTRFRNCIFEDPNLIMARFKVADADADSGDAELGQKAVPRPSLRAVRFEGDHLLDSVTACRLLATDGRPLVDMSLSVVVRSGPERVVRGRFPIRVALENNHVLVATGFGSGEYRLSLDVHQQVVEAVRVQMEQGIADPERLRRLAEKIAERAALSASPERADILNDIDV